MARKLLSRLLIACLTATVFAMAVLAQDRTELPLLVLVAVAGGGILIALWRRNDVDLTDVLVFAVLFRLALFWLPPSLSDDSYRYVWDGLVQAQEVNPYRFTPGDSALIALHDEPVFDLLNSPDYFTVYPPVSQFVFAFGTRFYDGGWLRSYYAIKLVFVLVELLAVLLLARMVPPRWLILYAWNPLVLLETAGQAHTESLLLLLLVLVVWWAKAGRGALASVALAGAGWVKLFPFVLFPFLWRRFRWQAVWPGAAVAAILALPYAASYVPANVGSSLDLYARLFEFNAGLYFGIKKVFLVLTGEDWSKQIGPALRVVFLAGLPVIYALDARFKWPLARAFLVTIAFYIVVSTTVHPWYLLSLLLLAVLLERASWHWYCLGLASIGTYLLYVDGPYWEFVILGWGGWLALASLRYGPSTMQALMRYRARRKFMFIRRYLPRVRKPLTVLDLGAAEGYVGALIQADEHADVVLADVVDMNRTDLRHVTLRGRHLPWQDDEFDVVVMYFVLHHADDQDQLFREALRVAADRVIVVESVFSGSRDRHVLEVLDRLANRLRSGRRMTPEEGRIHFRTVPEWRSFFLRHGAEIIAGHRRGRWVHKQAMFVVTKAG